MFKLLITLLVIVGAAVVGLFILAQNSKQAPETGLVSGKLRVCPETPNCLSSEANTTAEANRTSPLVLDNMDAAEAWQRMLAAVKQAGGEIQRQDGLYLYATFTSALFGFVDDFEARLDPDAGLIQLRSASRVGHSDFGANSKRIALIRQLWQQAPTGQ